MSTNSCGESLKEGSGAVVSHGFFNLLIRVSLYQKMPHVYGIFIRREEYQDAPLLGNEELWRLSGIASLPHTCLTCIR